MCTYPPDEGNPVQQLEANFSRPGTYQNPAFTGHDLIDSVEQPLSGVLRRRGPHRLAQLPKVLRGRLFGDGARKIGQSSVEGRQ
jgi:hypothetical protein